MCKNFEHKNKWGYFITNVAIVLKIFVTYRLLMDQIFTTCKWIVKKIYIPYYV